MRSGVTDAFIKIKLGTKEIIFVIRKKYMYSAVMNISVFYIKKKVPIIG